MTKDEISFAFIDGTEGRIDYIPFAEVKYVKEMKEQISDGFEAKQQLCVLQIATYEDGYGGHCPRPAPRGACSRRSVCRGAAGTTPAGSTTSRPTRRSSWASSSPSGPGWRARRGSAPRRRPSSGCCSSRSACTTSPTASRASWPPSSRRSVCPSPRPSPTPLAGGRRRQRTGKAVTSHPRRCPPPPHFPTYRP